MDKNAVLSRAINLAALAHAGQFRANGDPYILHPIRVMMQMDTVEEKIVAIVHDVLEDTEVTVDALMAEGIGDIPGAMLALNLLTKRSGQDYEAYIAKIAEHQTYRSQQLARKVKLADLRDNLNLLELPIVEPYHLKRAEKYYNAYRYLVGKQG